MIAAELFCDELAQRGFTVASGVPCSFFGGPIALLSRTPGSYVPAANEGAALATAAGVALAGGRAYVMLQNSGLGNLVNPLTSLVMTYQVPVLTFVSLRGWPDPADDEPQHEVMGGLTHPLLDLLGLPHWRLGADDGPERFAEILGAAEATLEKGQAPFVLVEKGAVGKAAGPVPAEDEGRLDSAEVVRLVSKLADGDPVVATTGYTGRELFGIDDQPRNFYMQGSMGHASSIALGVAMAEPERTVVVLDGDGAVLMHMGTLSSISDQAPANLVHVVLDNGIHESTGGQRTTSTATRIEEVAVAAGYRTAHRCHSLDEVRTRFEEARRAPGPHLVLIPTKRRTGAVPPRATNTHTPEAIRDRFSAALRKAAPPSF
ncbi:phosphonopyruvate decarboxylase [Saccharopolyspora erythraea]|uniref:phosphonopyruvate decarboxylase n=1 Tax=Saccharopolyspora erythraea TaxID=1836 RepID=UPI001BA769AD|nr:phosphonopyruvate decarboxylase [Saccharopolyspora erythraea]QUH06001.1 phosphonopyruvate decarboxylase [Saccharopolyspora erythraea]